jgi:hypothetical protein
MTCNAMVRVIVHAIATQVAPAQLTAAVVRNVVSESVVLPVVRRRPPP